MKIFMLSSEAFPFAKTGGLADAVSSLSKALEYHGDEVKILIPRYYSIDRTKLSLAYKNVFVSLGPYECRADFYKTKLPQSDVEIFFVDYEKFFGRDGFYGPSPTSDYQDNPLRFSFLTRSLFALCEAMNFSPDIIHLHDWQASMASVLLKFQENKKTLFKNTKSVLTIHNAGYQGKYPENAYIFTGLHDDLKFSSGFEDFGMINFLKAGVTCADKITTVSPNYANEIQNPEFGFGLDGLYRVRKNDLEGIVNGIDTEIWNPETDKEIPANFSYSSLNGKKICKSHLQKKFSLPENQDIPIVSMVTRLADQKGISEIFAPMHGCAWKICTELKVQFIIVGSGEKWCENEIRTLSEKLPNLKCYIGYSDSLSHLVEAGSDFFLMPSKYEPCGLNQIYSMRYGTLPIVRNTGGLHDTVKNCSEEKEEGTGFVFNDLYPEAIFQTVKWAVGLYEKNPTLIRKMQETAMKEDFSWEKSALEYKKVYDSLKK